MLKRLALFVLIGLTALYATSIFAHEPENIATLKQAIVHYYTTGEYEYDVQQTIIPAMQYLQQRLQENQQHQKLAIIFDIDDTLVLNYEVDKKLGFGGTYKEIIHTLLTTQSPAIPPSLKLYNFAKEHQIAIFLVTGREPFMKQSTIQTLKKAGYSDWTEIVFKPKKFRHHSASKFKSAIRKQIIDKGYDIVLSVGDQYSDLQGGYADRTLKLPNPMYFVP